MLITFSSLAPRCRIERLLDPTTSYLCLSINPNSHGLHIPSNLVRLCYYCSLLNHCLVCMQGCYQMFSCYSLDWCQNPLLGNVLGSNSPCIHQRKSNEIKFKCKMGEGTPPDELIQMARNKVAPKIHV